jgi:vancomycin resistance protein VanJ
MTTWRRRVNAWGRWLALGLGVGYPLALVGVAFLFRYVGESWAPTAVTLYLPRVGFAIPLPLVVVALLVARLRRLAWGQLASVFVLVFVLMGAVLPWPSRRQPGAPTMRVVSYNVESAVGGVDAIAEEIDRYSPDIAVLVEVAENDAMAQAMRERFPHVSVSTQFVVASKYPMTEPTDSGKLHYRDQLRSPRYVRQSVDTPLGRIALYAVHPISPREAFDTLRAGGVRHELSSGDIFSRSNAEAVEKNFGLRQLQVETFAEAAAHEADPVVIAGDTNLPTLSRVYGANLSRFQDGFVRAGSGLGYTFPNGRHGRWMRIDRILASDPLQFVGFEVGTSNASDHRCVVADLQRK